MSVESLGLLTTVTGILPLESTLVKSSHDLAGLMGLARDAGLSPANAELAQGSATRINFFICVSPTKFEQIFSLWADALAVGIGIHLVAGQLDIYIKDGVNILIPDALDLLSQSLDRLVEQAI